MKLRKSTFDFLGTCTMKITLANVMKLGWNLYQVILDITT